MAFSDIQKGHQKFRPSTRIEKCLTSRLFTLLCRRHWMRLNIGRSNFPKTKQVGLAQLRVGLPNPPPEERTRVTYQRILYAVRQRTMRAGQAVLKGQGGGASSATSTFVEMDLAGWSISRLHLLSLRSRHNANGFNFGINAELNTHQNSIIFVHHHTHVSLKYGAQRSSWSANNVSTTLCFTSSVWGAVW